ncbi:hypothetical protein BKA66DRAFT_477498 [Pyrenochaeta sp. MPI-SDFR-AT-0127]|nr:hypothetical protein BKA66DRAFT_477498 [Pyrenochaeta sp. MPI-SDFR-AT-0127]
MEIQTQCPDSSPTMGGAAKQQQPLEKKHISGALKFVVGEKDRAEALAGAAAWKMRFAEETKWKSILARMERIAREDHMRLDGGRQLSLRAHARRLCPTSSQAPTTSSTRQRPRPARLAPTSAYTSDYSRERWDVVSPGPVTPLSPNPKGNAFASGGYWDSVKLQATTLIPVAPQEPWSPAVPNDPEAKVAYDAVKREIDKIALKLCRSRLNIAFNSNDPGLVHPSMVSHKDTMYAAEITLQARHPRLEVTVDHKLREKIECLANEEAVILHQNCIQDSFALLDLDAWLQVDEKTLEMTTILDAQRDLLRMNRNRRKTKVLKVSEQAVQFAWATSILEDAQYMVEHKADDSSICSDEDEGYDYSNFLSSIKRDYGSTLDLSSTLNGSERGGSSLRSSNTLTIATDTTKSGQASLSARSSASPIKSSHGSLPSRLRELISTCPVNDEISCRLMRNSDTETTRDSNNAHISISVTKEDGEDEEQDGHDHSDKSMFLVQLSPIEKEFRHKGPTISDLSNWAQELKEMERKRAEILKEKGDPDSNSDSEFESGTSPQDDPTLQTSQDSHMQSGDVNGIISETEIGSNPTHHARRNSKSSINSTISTTTMLNQHTTTPASTSKTTMPRSTKRSPSFLQRRQHTGPIPLPPTYSTFHTLQTSSPNRPPPSPTLLNLDPNTQLPGSALLQPPTPTPTPTPTPHPRRYRHIRSHMSLRDTADRERVQHPRESQKDTDEKDEEEELWLRELARMEKREVRRQLAETGGYTGVEGEVTDEDVGVAL